MTDLEQSALAVYFANCQGIKSDPLPMLRKILELRDAEVARLEAALFRCFQLSGADTTNTPTDIASGAVDAVRDLRRDYDEACAELHPTRPESV